MTTKRIIVFINLCFLSLITTAQLKDINGGVYKWEEHPVNIDKLRETRKILEGTTPYFEHLQMHSTVMYPGAEPSEKCTHVDMEECIIVTEGQMRVTIEDKSAILGPAGVLLLLPTDTISIENIGETNLTYFVMKYKSKKKMDLARGMANGGSLMLNADSLKITHNGDRSGRKYFDRSTAMCERFEMHVTFLNKQGLSHTPHEHAETEIILVLSGETEMTIDGKEYQAKKGDFYFITSPSVHGIRNATNKPCSYFAFKWN